MTKGVYFMNCNPIPKREDWFITDMKPTICPHCGARKVWKAVLAFSLFFRKYAYIGSNLLLIALLLAYLGLFSSENIHIGVDDYANSRRNVERN